MSPHALRRAKAYPYSIPPHSYVVANGGHEELTASASQPNVDGCRAVLAVGSNQSPEQLLRKFPAADWGPIPVIQAQLADFDIVYSPHVTSYGSIPSTICPSLGTLVTLFVNWLTPSQEAHMHETEVATGNYHFGRLDGIDLQLELGGALSSAYVYCSSRGSLVHKNAPVALAEIKAKGRKWPSLNQEAMQAHVWDQLSTGEDIDDFILQAIADRSIRQARAEAMMVGSIPFSYPGFTS